MGSDLSVGCVVGDDLRCAFHHWQYGPDGRCTKIPSGDRIPGAARVFSFPTEERYGLIWVFFGETPLYDIPSFPSWVLEHPMIWRAFEVQLSEPLMVEPWVFVTNVFDFAHFRVVHKVEGLDPDVETDGQMMQWTADLPHPTVGSIRMTGQCWGTNVAMSFGRRDGFAVARIGGMTWMGPNRGTRCFTVAGAELGGEGEAARAQAEASLDAQQALSTQLINEDLPIMNTLRLGDDHLVGADRKLAAYLRFVRDYPRATMADFGG
jgi:phenylpropionate dioxygenase-like ring-hydroxylating dioxygenase large terminal subunit